MRRFSLFALFLMGACSVLFRNLSAPECTETRCSNDQSFALVCEHPDPERPIESVEHSVRCSDESSLECVPDLLNASGVEVAGCTICGDGLIDRTLLDDSLEQREECDDGNQSNTDACLNTCRSASCGDTFIQEGVEECDDGNQSNTDACLNICETARCGDGFIRSGTEQCDDGSGNSNTAPNACRSNCTNPKCGDGVIDTGEDCDGSQLGSETCETQSVDSPNGTLSCDTDCTFDLSECTL